MKLFCQELQAEIAAERLAERLHIKLETYNPEGVDMRLVQELTLSLLAVSS